LQSSRHSQAAWAGRADNMRRVVFPKRAVPPSIAHAIRDAESQSAAEADDSQDKTDADADKLKKEVASSSHASGASSASNHTADANGASEPDAQPSGWQDVHPGDYVVVCVTAASAQTLRGVPIAKATIAEFHQVRVCVCLICFFQFVCVCITDRIAHAWPNHNGVVFLFHFTTAFNKYCDD
jgi:hypothetical protein